MSTSTRNTVREASLERTARSLGGGEALKGLAKVKNDDFSGTKFKSIFIEL